MKRLFFWIVLVPLAGLLVVFAVTNRQGITLDLWPLPFQVDLPLYLALLGTLILGFVVGVVVASVSAAGRRARRARAERDRAGGNAPTVPQPGTDLSLPKGRAP